MRKLIAIGVLIGGLHLAGATPALAQGNADPLSLAASGVLIPFITASSFTSQNDGVTRSFTAVVEVASPVGLNDGRGGSFPLHLVFFNTTCDRQTSVGLPETTNDIGFVDVGSTLSPLTNVNGLVAIGGTGSGNSLVPLSNPIHSRVYEFGVSDGRSRIFEPIIIDSYDFQSAANTWSPLRTAATFYAPQETSLVKTVLTLVCPNINIQDNTTTSAQVNGVFPITPTAPDLSGFPTIAPKFNATTTGLEGRVYDTNEIFLRDVTITCNCLTEVSVATFTGGGIYSSSSDPANTIGATLGTYTELNVPAVATKGSFTGYRSVSTQGSLSNNFFGRLSNGSMGSIRNNVLTGTR